MDSTATSQRTSPLTRHSLLALLTLALVAGPICAQSTPPKAELPLLKVGDRWKIEQRDRRTGAKGDEWVRSIATVSSQQIEGTENDSKMILTPELNIIESATTSAVGEPLKLLSFPLEVGKRWSVKTTGFNKVNQSRVRVQLSAEVVGYERIKMIAGEFDAFKLEAKGYWNNDTSGGNGRVTYKYWYAPAARTIVKTELDDGYSPWIRELVEYQLQP